MRHEHSLDALKFFLADVRQGLGPYPRSTSSLSGIGLRISVGASLTIGLGSLNLSEAFKAIDLAAIALLLGMMNNVSQLRVSDFMT